VNTTPAPAIDTLTCSYFECETIVADDLGDGWLRLRGTAHADTTDKNVYCEAHAPEGSIAIEDEVNILRVTL
jgi:hypothetical protein